MAERLSPNETVEVYWQSGGVLDRNGFTLAGLILSAVKRGEDIGPMNKSSLMQVQQMSEYSKIPITLEQKMLYSALRGITKDSEERIVFSLETPGTLPVWSLGDQQLLAEVIRLTDEKSLNAFKSAYPESEK